MGGNKFLGIVMVSVLVIMIALASIVFLRSPSTSTPTAVAEVTTDTPSPTPSSTSTPTDTPSPIPPTYTPHPSTDTPPTFIPTEPAYPTETFTPVTPSSTPTYTPTATSTPTPTPTNTPTPTATPIPTLYPAPTLTAPDNGEGSFGKFPPLKWQWDDKLAEDEYFEVRVWHESITDYRPGLGWVKERVFDYNIGSERRGQYYWTVVVVKDEYVRYKDWYKPEYWPYPVWEHDPDKKTDSIQIMSLESEPRFFEFTPSKEGGEEGGGQSPISCPPGDRSC